MWRLTVPFLVMFRNPLLNCSGQAMATFRAHTYRDQHWEGLDRRTHWNRGFDEVKLKGDYRWGYNYIDIYSCLPYGTPWIQAISLLEWMGLMTEKSPLEITVHFYLCAFRKGHVDTRLCHGWRKKTSCIYGFCEQNDSCIQTLQKSRFYFSLVLCLCNFNPRFLRCSDLCFIAISNLEEIPWWLVICFLHISTSVCVRERYFMFNISNF